MKAPWRRWCRRFLEVDLAAGGEATQVAPHPPHLPWPPPAYGTRNSLLPALMAIRWCKWKITALAWGRAGNWRLCCLVCVRAFSWGDESTSTPPFPHEHPRGPGAPSQSLGVAVPQGWPEDGVVRSGFPGSPAGKPPCPAPAFSRPREPEGIPNSAFSAGANGAQFVCGGGVWGCLCGQPEIELPLHLGRAADLLPAPFTPPPPETRCPCPYANLR